MRRGQMRQPRIETVVEREIFAEDGTVWRVREARAHDVPGAQRESCLIADSGKICRRLWHFPESWTELSSEQVLEIFERRR
jgi:hypothetical protein